MRKRIDNSDMPIGKLIRIKDSLPSPATLAKSRSKRHNIHKQEIKGVRSKGAGYAKKS